MGSSSEGLSLGADMKVLNLHQEGLRKSLKTKYTNPKRSLNQITICILRSGLKFSSVVHSGLSGGEPGAALANFPEYPVEKQQTGFLTTFFLLRR